MLPGPRSAIQPLLPKHRARQHGNGGCGGHGTPKHCPARPLAAQPAAQPHLCMHRVQHHRARAGASCRQLAAAAPPEPPPPAQWRAPPAAGLTAFPPPCMLQVSTATATGSGRGRRACSSSGSSGSGSGSSSHEAVRAAGPHTPAESSAVQCGGRPAGHMRQGAAQTPSAGSSAWHCSGSNGVLLLPASCAPPRLAACCCRPGLRARGSAAGCLLVPGCGSLLAVPWFATSVSTMLPLPCLPNPCCRRIATSTCGGRTMACGQAALTGTMAWCGRATSPVSLLRVSVPGVDTLGAQLIQMLCPSTHARPCRHSLPIPPACC